jgi:hypothetical protein
MRKEMCSDFSVKLGRTQPFGKSSDFESSRMTQKQKNKACNGKVQSFREPKMYK